MDTYKCADPGCRAINSSSSEKCSHCSLPKDVSYQYFSQSRGAHRGGRSKFGGRWSKPGGRGGRRGQQRHTDHGVDLSNPTVAPFVDFAQFLDSRHDQHERIFKLSRDITIESKRVIFLLHRIQSDDKSESVLNEAKRKLDDIRFRLWLNVASELEHANQPYLYLRAYTGGLQEYIEALSFYQFIREGTFIAWEQVQENLTFYPNRHGRKAEVPEVKQDEKLQAKEKISNESCEKNFEPSQMIEEKQILSNESNVSESKDSTAAKTAADATEVSFCVLVPKMDFLLGIADLTGEMMRKAVNAAAAGNAASSFSIYSSMQILRAGFLALNLDSYREMSRKLITFEASLKKVEAVCYNINIRSTEMPQHLVGKYLSLHDYTADENPQTSEEVFDE